MSCTITHVNIYILNSVHSCRRANRLISIKCRSQYINESIETMYIKCTFFYIHMMYNDTYKKQVAYLYTNFNSPNIY